PFPATCRGSNQNATCLLRSLAVVSNLPVQRLTRASEFRQCSSPRNKGNFATQFRMQQVSAAKSPRLERHRQREWPGRQTASVAVARPRESGAGVRVQAKNRETKHSNASNRKVPGSARMTTEPTQPQPERGPSPANGQGQSQGHRRRRRRRKNKSSRQGGAP